MSKFISQSSSSFFLVSQKLFFVHYNCLPDLGKKISPFVIILSIAE